MGLDMIELLLEVEEHFGVTIPDERAERMTSVGKLYSYLLGQARRNTPTACPTSQAFYRLRRMLTGELGVDRAQVRPATQLRDLFPRASRDTIWPRVGAALGLPDLPDLDPPRRGPSARAFRIAVAAAMAACWLLSGVLLLVPGGQLPFLVWLLVRFLAVLLVCLFFGLFWLAAYLDPLPRPQVRDLVIRLAVQSPNPYRDRNATDPAAAAVWTDLVAILAAHTDVPAHEIHPEHRFSDLIDC
jgi:hypothetical protein